MEKVEDATEGGGEHSVLGAVGGTIEGGGGGAEHGAVDVTIDGES